MSDKDKIISVIATIDSMLLLDFMTDPVRADLTSIKTLLEEVRDKLKNFINAYSSDEIIFEKGCTEGFNF